MTGICSACGLTVEYHKGRRCRDCVNTWAREHYAKGGDRTRAIKRDYMARMRQDAAYRERTNAVVRERYAVRYAPRNREYRQSLKKDFFAYRARSHRHRFKVQVTNDDFRNLWTAQGGKCALTGWELDDTAQIDHIVPIARGGGHDLSNLRWVCPVANRAKRELTDDELVALAEAIVQQLAGRKTARRMVAVDGEL